ncbi:nuclear transport factor 2 family protein [Streptosporangium sp. NPDC002544]|uniref:nuclear transport factor 2 family protein n=1 Tax=unclassified Streptosporangium TaxID=2632669 RepID=UPI0033183146
MNTRPVEELIHWFAEEYNKGVGYAKVVLHPEGTLVERPSAAYPEGRTVDLAGLMGMEERQLALQPDRKITLERVAALAEEGHGLMQYTHVGHTADGTELTFWGLSLLEFRDDLVYRWVDTVVRFKQEPGATERVPY